MQAQNPSTSRQNNNRTRTPALTTVAQFLHVLAKPLACLHTIISRQVVIVHINNFNLDLNQQTQNAFERKNSNSNI
jgi:hypothetical protein